MENATCPRATSRNIPTQERKADHIAQSYENKGVSDSEAERRAWASVNKDDGGGKKSGSGRGKSTGHPAAHKGGKAAARLRPIERPLPAPIRPKRPPRPASATPRAIRTAERGAGAAGQGRR